MWTLSPKSPNSNNRNCVVDTGQQTVGCEADPRVECSSESSNTADTSNYAKLVLLELSLYDAPVQSTVRLFWFCIL